MKQDISLPQPIAQRYNCEFLFSLFNLISTPPTPEEKKKTQRAPSRSHLSCHLRSSCWNSKTPPPPGPPHCRCCVTAKLASGCSHLRLHGGGKDPFSSRFPSAVSFQVENAPSGRKCTFYFNQGVNPPRPPPTVTLF